MKTNLFTGNCPASVNDWFLTDDDCLQYCKVDPFDKKKGTYTFVQSNKHDYNDYSIVTDTIDIYDYVGVEDELAYEFIIQLLDGYGYGVPFIREDMDDKHWCEILLKEFKEQYRNSWKRVFAECIFETQIQYTEKVDTHLTMKCMYEVLSKFLQTN